MGPFCNLKTKTNPQINTNLYITKNNKIIPIFMIKSIYFHSWTPYKVGAKKKKERISWLVQKEIQNKILMFNHLIRFWEIDWAKNFSPFL